MGSPNLVDPSKPCPLHVLVSYAYIGGRKAMRFDLDQLAEVGHLFIDSGAYTNHHAMLKQARKGEEVTAPITMKGYMDFLRSLGFDHLYGAITFDVIGNAEATERNTQTMLDAGMRPAPVLTMGEDPERVNDLRKINEVVCVSAGMSKSHGEAARAARIRAVAAEVDGPVRLHGLAHTRYPGMMQLPLHSADSVSYKAGEQWGLLQYMDGLRLRSSRIKGKERDLPFRKFLPLRADISRIIAQDKAYLNGSRGFLSFATTFAHMKASRVVWKSGRRYFFATANTLSLRTVIACYYALEIDPRPRTTEEFAGLLTSLFEKDGARMKPSVAQAIADRKHQ